jgi:predicted nucleotide-binding protein
MKIKSEKEILNSYSFCKEKCKEVIKEPEFCERACETNYKWMFCSVNYRGAYFYKPEIIIVSQDTFKIWVKVILSKEGKLKFIEDLIKEHLNKHDADFLKELIKNIEIFKDNLEILNYVLCLLWFDFYKNYMIEKFIFYDLNNLSIFRVFTSTSWNPIPPDSPIEPLFEEVFSCIKEAQKTKEIQKIKPKRIFIVHGRDEEMKQAVARTLEKLDLEPIILHEQPSKGRTIIEKFEDYSDVSYAIVLLSPDDLAYPKDSSSEKAKYRARQNVIFELGFFIGKLGRERVCALYKKAENFEIPTDYEGVIYIPYDKEGGWKLKLAQELKTCSFDIDANKL